MLGTHTEYVLIQAHALIDVHTLQQKHITLNSYQVPDKASKDRPKTLKFEQYSGLHVYCIYAYCRYRTTGYIVEINRCAPKTLHSCTALLLGHIR